MLGRTFPGMEPIYSASSRDWLAKIEGAKAHCHRLNSTSRLLVEDNPQGERPFNELPLGVIGLR